jgi:anti-anti-sigma factor
MITLSSRCDGLTLTIKVPGRLDFSCCHDFRACYAQAPASVRHYVVDLADATHLDPSALGMLLLLRAHAGGGDKVLLLNMNNGVWQTLSAAGFDRLFCISPSGFAGSQALAACG